MISCIHAIAKIVNGILLTVTAMQKLMLEHSGVTVQFRGGTVSTAALVQRSLVQCIYATTRMGGGNLMTFTLAKALLVECPRAIASAGFDGRLHSCDR